MGLVPFLFSLRHHHPKSGRGGGDLNSNSIFPSRASPAPEVGALVLFTPGWGPWVVSRRCVGPLQTGLFQESERVPQIAA